MVQQARQVKVAISFKDGGEDYIIEDLETLKKSELLLKTVSQQYSDFQNTDQDIVTEFDAPEHIDREAVIFTLRHLATHVAPESRFHYPTLSDYPELNEKSIDELREIIRAADFFICPEFQDCVGFVIVNKGGNWSTDKLGEYMSVMKKSEEEIKQAKEQEKNDEKNWMKPGFYD